MTVIALADDFSGAAEIAGIGSRYGLKSEVQLQLDVATNANLIVLNTDTRALTESGAVRKIQSLTQVLSNSGAKLFVKVDSVMRGHITGEIQALQAGLQFKRALLLPANPARGRSIVNGEYYVNRQLLSQSVFKDDPVFPAKTSNICHLMASASHHIHLSAADTLPTADSFFIITGDLNSKEDFDGYLSQTGEGDLVCGAAECFSAYLRHLKYNELERAKFSAKPFTLIINGSTIVQSDVDSKHTFKFPGHWVGKSFEVGREELQHWQSKVIKCLQTFGIAKVVIGHKVNNAPESSNLFEQHFTALITAVSKTINLSDLSIGLTGGATACGIIKRLGVSRLSVIGELDSGVVYLSANNFNANFAVKPGSYLWPEKFLNKNVSCKGNK